MSPVWITTASTHPGHVLNSLTAACSNGFVPKTVHLLANPSVTAQVDPIRDGTETVLDAYGVEEPTIQHTTTDSETDFEAIAAHYREASLAAQEADKPVAIDVTPGRKFMSAIAFQAGFKYDVDHVYYLHVKSGRFRGLLYPEIPRTGVELIDFTEAFA